MTSRQAVFAVPGDITTKTGGYIYDAELVAGLRRAGWQITLVELPEGFPVPDTEVMDRSFASLAEVDGQGPMIIDGLAFGAMDTGRLAALQSPLVPLVHHPIGWEPGLPPDLASDMVQREAANLALARHVLVPSPHTAAALTSAFAVAEEDLTIAIPGVSRPKAHASVPADPPLILSVGILTPRKGHDVLLKALARVQDLDWQAQIIGRVHEEDHAADLGGLITELGLESRVALRGLVSEDALATAYGAASIFALATRYEGYGMVFAEALVRGLPIVTCATGAVPDTVPVGAGMLVPAEDDAGFAEVLRRMLTEPETRRAHGEAARQAGASLPGWDDTAALVSGVLSGI